jgi:hypothetical protein
MVSMTPSLLTVRVRCLLAQPRRENQGDADEAQT